MYRLVRAGHNSHISFEKFLYFVTVVVVVAFRFVYFFPLHCSICYYKLFGVEAFLAYHHLLQIVTLEQKVRFLPRFVLVKLPLFALFTENNLRNFACAIAC